MHVSPLVSYLDLPDLAALAAASGQLAILTADPVLHRTRLLVVAPSRLSHSLFGLGPEGTPLRPTIPDLVHRGVMKGPGILWRWRMGLYFYSPQASIYSLCISSGTLYDTCLRLQRNHASTIVASNLRRRSRSPNLLEALHRTRVFPDVESSSLSISRSLLPIMRKLKWSIRRDGLAKRFRSEKGSEDEQNASVARWIESRSTILVGESERVRLAVCPGVRKIVDFYEHLASSSGTTLIPL
ncbi:hypothetical protein BV25DRAFT_1904549 [Artomyces pyxidatus]|uniref:Uncharacterized protein n=1 Tax=Artomyces pyxidatus TaxID=48021 RepID=A0ACB8TI57_9AGAM|nr:hypothetical protein BV25DRAFT_1904549 [Artomyces pyxidatus]